MTPRYGDQVVGGAEMVMSELAHGLAGRGWDVEILTTRARDHFTWANEYPSGTFRDRHVVVRRFATDVALREPRADLGSLIASGAPVTVSEQQRWANAGMRSPELFHWLLDNARAYRALLFAPYLFWTTFAGTQVAPERTVVMPCLHDEPYAYLELFQPVLEGSRGAMFLSEPEHALAHRIFRLPARHDVVGAGVRAPLAYEPEAFRRKHGITGRFVVYAGRREGAKGWEQLLESFAYAVQRHHLPFSLVTMGVGAVHPPSTIADRVVDLGFVSASERDSALAAADAYLQPSQLESFSRTIMEAWLAGTLVIANAASNVVRWHCERSGAGLTYDDDVELGLCLQFAAEAPESAAQLAARGRAYVTEHYAPDLVVERVERCLAEWLPDSVMVSATPEPQGIAR